MSSNALKESYDLSVQNYYTFNINCVTADSASPTQLLICNVTRPFPSVHIIKNRADRSGTETTVTRSFHRCSNGQSVSQSCGHRP